MLFFSTLTWGQDEDVGYAVYVDSAHGNVHFNSDKRIRQARSVDVIYAHSREGHINVTMQYDENTLTNGMCYSLKAAMDLWENYILFDRNIYLFVGFSSDMQPDVEVKSIVSYSRITSNGAYRSIPTNLWNAVGTNAECTDTIWVNANIDWSYSLASDSYIGDANLTTVLIRHIGHVLGFGTSLRTENDVLHFTIPRAPSFFDAMVVNRAGTRLSSFGYNTNTSACQDYLRSELYLSLPSGDYRLYTDSLEYKEFQTCKYFSMQPDNLMNYPVSNPTALFDVNKETLEALGLIGWNVRPGDVEISATNLDAIGYGSAYMPHSFHALDSLGVTQQAPLLKWQLFNYNTSQYETIDSVFGTSFIVDSIQPVTHAIDLGKYMNGRCVCVDNDNGNVYSKLVILDLSPIFVSYEISNITPTNNYYVSFDLTIECHGSTSGSVAISNEYASTYNRNFNGDGIISFHFNNVFRFGNSNLTVILNNGYDSVLKTFDLGVISEINSSIMASANTPFLSVTKNGIPALENLVIRDGDVLEFAIENYDPETIASWQIVSPESDEADVVVDVPGSSSFSFVMEPSVWNSIFKQCRTDFDEETGIYYKVGYVRASLTSADGSETLSFPFRVDVLPTKPRMRIVNYMEEKFEDRDISPTVDLEIYAYNFNKAAMEVTGGTFWPVPFTYYVDDLSCDLPMPQIHRSEQGNLGCGYVLTSYNDYGSAVSDTVYPDVVTRNDNVRHDPMHMTVDNHHFVLRMDAPQESITIADVSGRIWSHGAGVSDVSVWLPKGIYVLKIRNKETGIIRKFNIK